MMQELAESPLMLSLMPLAYGGVTAETLSAAESVDDGRDRLLGAYVAKVFERRPVSVTEAYEKAQAVHWLSFIAQGLDSHNQTIFRLEELQPTWLSTKNRRTQYFLIVKLIVGLIYGLIVGLIVGLIAELMDGLIIGLIYGLIGGLVGKNIRIWDKEVFTPSSPNQQWQTGKDGLLVGLVFGVIIGLIADPFLGLIVGLTFWSSVILRFEMKVIPSQRPKPNHGLFKIQKGQVISGAVIGLLAGLLSALFTGLTDGLTDNLIGGFVAGIVFGLVFGLGNLISHYMIRYFLAKDGLLPFPWSSLRKKNRDRELIAYLDSMTDRWLLRRVGNGWVFRHRYLLEYFAERSAVKLEKVERKCLQSDHFRTNHK